MTTAKKIAVAGMGAIGAVIAYLALVRPRLNRWGANNTEAGMRLPGDEFLPPDADRITHVIDVEADVEDVWPWLIQIGQGRAGFYSYSWLENLMGSEIANTTEIKSNLQELREGDTISLHPKAPPFKVVLIDRPQNIVLQATDVVTLGKDGKLTDLVWSFHLRPHGRGSCRFIARARAMREPGLRAYLGELFVEPGHFLFERKMMLTIKALAERSQRTLHRAKATAKLL